MVAWPTSRVGIPAAILVQAVASGSRTIAVVALALLA
jgi:hypothetical protein